MFTELFPGFWHGTELSSTDLTPSTQCTKPIVKHSFLTNCVANIFIFLYYIDTHKIFFRLLIVKKSHRHISRGCTSWCAMVRSHWEAGATGLAEEEMKWYFACCFVFPYTISVFWFPYEGTKQLRDGHRTKARSLAERAAPGSLCGGCRTSEGSVVWRIKATKDFLKQTRDNFPLSYITSLSMFFLFKAANWN